MSEKLKYVALLKEKYKHYDVQTNFGGKRPVDATKPNSGMIFEVRAEVTIFDYAEEAKGAYTVKKVSALADGPTVASAEDSAIVRALQHLGLEA